MSGRVCKGTGLTGVGDFELLNEFAAPVTKQESGILSPAVEVQAQPSDEDLTYMARELVQCTLPHSDPGQVPFWKRTNGNLTISITSDYDPQTGKLVGYPFGSTPRLLRFSGSGSRRSLFAQEVPDLSLERHTGIFSGTRTTGSKHRGWQKHVTPLVSWFWISWCNALNPLHLLLKVAHVVPVFDQAELIVFVLCKSLATSWDTLPVLVRISYSLNFRNSSSRATQSVIFIGTRRVA